MKKYWMFFVAILLVCAPVLAQTVSTERAKLSPLTQQYLNIKNNSKQSSAPANYVSVKIGNQVYLSALIKVMPGFNEQGLINLDVLVGTKAGDIWIVKIPEQEIENFMLLKKIVYIQLDEPIFRNLSAARAKMRVDSIHQGISLPQAYTGKDVVVGILDVGFDYGHPTLYDTSGNKYRVKRIWEQKINGTAPANFSYGNEIVDTLAMIAAQTDNSDASHGTHVAGIAAGSGFGGPSPEAYRGIAYESDLVLVGITPSPDQWTNAGMSDIIDGMNYVYSYADAQGKAAVVNLSWGCSIGPNDGSSLFSQACDNLTGEGKIFTISAGNNGGDNIHLQKQFTPTDTIVSTFVKFSTYFSPKKTWVDIWGDNGKDFSVKLQLYYGSYAGDSIFFVNMNNSTLDTFLISHHGDTCYFTLITIAADYNGKPHAFIDLHSETYDKVCVSLKSTEGTVNMWMGYVHETVGYYGQFWDANMSWAVNGDDHMILGEMACTQSAITVGAYASKISFANLYGQNLSYSGSYTEGDIVSFSSKGPTADYRSKPEIAAPGLTIASSVNSYDLSYAVGGSSYQQSVHKYTHPTTARDYYYAEMSGTSMASPMTAGVVALLLEADSSLTPEDVKGLIKYTAIKDSFTTQTPDPYVWGAGKLNAYGALMMIPYAAVPEYPMNESLTIYPNPANNQLTIELDNPSLANKELELCIYSVTGNLVIKKKANAALSTQVFNIEELKDGMYFYSLIIGQQKVKTGKLMVVK